MNIFKRASTYIKRNLFHSLALFLLILLLGILSLGSVTTIKIISATEDNLWLNLPGVAMIEYDQYKSEVYFARYGTWPSPHVSHELIEEVAQLSYINRVYSILPHFMIAEGLDIYWPNNVRRNIMSFRYMGIYHVESFRAFGVSNPIFAELSFGIINVISGSSFTYEHIATSAPVILISQEFATNNGLAVGSHVTFLDIFSARGWFDAEEYNDIRPPIQEIKFEVIGVYELQTTMAEFGSGIGDGEHVSIELRMLNTIFTPYGALSNFLQFENQVRYDLWGSPPFWPNIQNLLVLNDPREMPIFQEAVNEILPDFLIATNVGDRFNNVFTAMDNIYEIAVFILSLVIGSAFFITILLIMLILRIRQHEIGIYLALGEKKIKIYMQFLAEILIITILAITFALFANKIVSSQISHTLVTEEIAGVQIDRRILGVQIGNALFERREHILDWFVPEVREFEEILEVFDVSIAINDIIIFYAASFGIIIFATSLSMIYVMRLKPKDILTLGERG